MDSIRIKVSGDASDLQPTIDKLKEVGKVSDDNANKFKKSSEEFQSAAKLREQLLQREIQNLEAIKRARDKATNVENITAYNKSIKDQEKIIKDLTPSTEKAVSSMNNFGTSIKKSYGFLRIMANIIPGIGISGIIMAGYEALSNIIKEILDDTNSLRVEQTQDNAEHLEALNRIITKERELSYEIEKRNILLGIEAKKNTIEDLSRLQLREENEKELMKIALYYIKKTKDEEAKLIDPKINPDKSVADKQFEYYTKINQIQYDKERESKAQYQIYINKLAEIDEKEKTRKKKYIEDISTQELENQKKRTEVNAKLLSSQAKEEITDKIELDKRLYEIESDKNTQILHLDQQITKKKRDHDILIAEKTITDADELNNRLYNINLAYKDKISALNNGSAENQLLADQEMYDKLLSDLDKYSEEEAKKIESDLKKRLAAVKENEQRLADVLKLENETNYTEGKITQDQHDQQDIKDQLAVLELKKTNLESFSNEYIEIEIKEQELKRQLRDQEKKDLKKDIEEMTTQLKQMQEYFLSLYKERIQANIDYTDHQETLTQSSIQQQQELAIAGKENTLAFEKRNLAEEEKKRIDNEKKLKKEKELEIFLNSLASFSKDDPKTALSKALTILALTKGAEATFAEDGGLLGQINNKSWQGRKHKGGGDILVHAQTGEGILSRNDISAMGGEQAFLNFKNMLGNGLPSIPMSGVMFQGVDIKPLQDEIKELRKDIANKKEMYVDFESMKDMLAMNVTTTERGIKEVVKHELKRRTIRG